MPALPLQYAFSPAASHIAHMFSVSARLLRVLLMRYNMRADIFFCRCRATAAAAHATTSPAIFFDFHS